MGFQVDKSNNRGTPSQPHTVQSGKMGRAEVIFIPNVENLPANQSQKGMILVSRLVAAVVSFIFEAMKHIKEGLSSLKQQISRTPENAYNIDTDDLELLMAIEEQEEKRRNNKQSQDNSII